MPAEHLPFDLRERPPSVAQREHRLPLSSFDALVAIAHSENGEITISDLAEQVMLSPSRISRLMIEFERNGLVERRRSASDARSTRAAITDKGGDRLREAAPTYLATVKALLIDKRLVGGARAIFGASAHRAEGRSSRSTSWAYPARRVQ